MGFIKKFAGIFMGDDIDDEEEVTEETAEDGEGSEERGTEPVTENAPPAKAPQKNVELKVVRLSAYDSGVTRVADHLLKKRTVVLILESVERESVKRIIDFLTGVVYSIHGSLKLVSGGTYIITPSNVEITNDQIEEATRTEDKDEGYTSSGSIEGF